MYESSIQHGEQPNKKVEPKCQTHKRINTKKVT